MPTPPFVPQEAGATPRLLIVPGLRDSGPVHWQTWLQSLHRDAVRVHQRDWDDPALDRWALQIGTTLHAHGEGPWVVAAHSFGCLALLRYRQLDPRAPIAAALLVAPADPAKFGLDARLATARADPAWSMIYSETDPWLAAADARRWARTWGLPTRSLGAAGHVNAESGFGPWPWVQGWVQRQRQAAGARVAATRCRRDRGRSYCRP